MPLKHIVPVQLLLGRACSPCACRSNVSVCIPQMWNTFASNSAPLHSCFPAVPLTSLFQLGHQQHYLLPSPLYPITQSRLSRTQHPCHAWVSFKPCSGNNVPLNLTCAGKLPTSVTLSHLYPGAQHSAVSPKFM